MVLALLVLLEYSSLSTRRVEMWGSFHWKCMYSCYSQMKVHFPPCQTLLNQINHTFAHATLALLSCKVLNTPTCKFMVRYFKLMNSVVKLHYGQLVSYCSTYCRAAEFRASINSSPPTPLPSATYICQWIRSELVQIMACHLFSGEPLS